MPRAILQRVGRLVETRSRPRNKSNKGEAVEPPPPKEMRQLLLAFRTLNATSADGKVPRLGGATPIR